MHNSVGCGEVNRRCTEALGAWLRRVLNIQKGRVSGYEHMRVMERSAYLMMDQVNPKP
jgi:hypothetical protein